MMTNWNALIPDAPFDWALIPLDGRKRPIDPDTGDLKDDWQQQDGYDVDGISALNGQVHAVGLMLGEKSGGVLQVDYDGPASPAKFQEVYGKSPKDLPRTIGVTSGKESRGSRFFLVDRDWWDSLRGRKVWKDADGDICLELRWAGHQAVIAGKHPETNGYSWMANSSPADLEMAMAPDWLLEPLIRTEASYEPVEVSAEDAQRAIAMLQCIDPNSRTDYDGWLEIGMALHHTDTGLLSNWIEWSQQMPNFDEAECLQKWEGFADYKGQPLTIGTLHHYAKKGGYIEPKRQPVTKPQGGVEGVTDGELLPLSERISNRIQELLDAHLANIPSEIDAAFAELYRLGVARDRAEERILMLWADSHGLDISTGSKPRAQHRGRVLGEAKEGKGLRQQLPGFGLDKDLHLLVSDAGGGKTAGMCELVTVMTARDKGFLDHEAPRTDPADDPRTTALVIASDGESSAYSMWEDYIDSISGLDRGAKVEIWAQDDDTGESSWNVSLHNMERLIKRMEEGDVAIVVMDTANAILRGAGVNVGIGPVETYLRLLKQIVCKHAPLWISQHTNRGGGTTMKSIGGHPAFQEVPSVIHLIEAKEQADGSKMRVWHVLKLRGCPYRRFSYELRDGELRVTDGHLFENCREQLLVLLYKQILGGEFTTPSDLIRLSKRPPQSVYSALGELRSLKLIRARGRGYRMTAAGERVVESLRVASEQIQPEGPEWAETPP